MFSIYVDETFKVFNLILASESNSKNYYYVFTESGSLSKNESNFSTSVSSKSSSDISESS